MVSMTSINDETPNLEARVAVSGTVVAEFKKTSAYPFASADVRLQLRKCTNRIYIIRRMFREGISNRFFYHCATQPSLYALRV